ncbi:MAG: glycosyltransferase family 4 protein [Anaerolineae bacterium]|nr:glycosyltransferase family 4 protein [Anaerolineae bacterium]
MFHTDLTILVGPEDGQRLKAIDSVDAPRLDYRLVADRCRGVIQECYPSPTALHGPKPVRLLRSVCGNLGLATRLVKSARPGSVIYSTGETWGLPVAIAGALLGRRSFLHIVYVHRVYSRLWLQMLRWLRSFLHVDGWICITEFQARLLRETLGQRRVPISVIPQGVDTTFFAPCKAREEGTSGYLLSIGAEMRDYSVLLDAARSLNTEVIVKASSTWMSGTRQRVTSLPPNVKLITEHVSYPELRDLYAGAALVVLPLVDTPQAAGITTIFEALAMEKCVVATRSRGLPDALVDGHTAVIAEPKSEELAKAISSLLSQPETARHIGANGHRVARQELSLEAHALAVEHCIQQVVQQATPRTV